MKTIAVVMPGNQYCGIQDHANFLNKELQKNWRLVEIKMSDPKSTMAWKRTALAANTADIVLVHYEYGLFGSVKPYRNIFARFIKYLKPPAIVILHDLLPELKPRKLRKDVYRVQDSLRNLVYLPFFSTWSIKLYGLADHFIVHAPPLQKRVQTLVPGTEVSFHEHPVPISSRQWSFEQSKIYTFVSPGFIKQHKGYLDFLEILNSRPDWTWLVAGGKQDAMDRQFFEYFISKIKSMGLLDRVTISGYLSRETIELKMSQAQVAVFPYQRVSNSGSVAWAVGMGMPVMTSDLETFQSLADDGAGLALLPSNKIDQWPMLVNDLLSDDLRLQQLALENRAFGRKNSFIKMAQHVSDIAMDVLQELGENRKRGDIE
jgi:glycosyltransferase involved in cell wall biosynthesis